MKPEATKVAVELAGGKQLSIETGKIAKQAGGAAVVRFGENVVLAAATSNPEPARASTSSRSRSTIANTPMPADVCPRRLYQARRPHERARNSHLPPD